MINNKPFIFLLVILCIYAVISCKDMKEVSEFDERVIKLDIRKTLNQQEKTLFLSGLTDEIKYIPLETNNFCLLYGVHKLFLTGDHIFISDSNGLYQFDLSGRFVRQIGGPGKGPGEHGTRIRFTVDTVRKEIMIFSSSIMNVYDLETGTYVRNFHLNMDVSDFAVFPQGNLILFTSELPPEAVVSSVNEVYLVDTNGKIVDSVPNYNRLNLERKSVGYAIYYSIKKDEHRYIYNFGDTLYTINSNFGRAPYVVFDFDNKITSDKLVIEPIYDRIQFPDFIWISIILENSEYLFLTIQKGIALMFDRDIQNFVYDKSTGDLVPTSGFINDIDGGLTFWPRSASGNKLVTSYLASEIIEYYGSTVGTVDHSEYFINFVNNLDESDNPVLVFIENNI